MHMEYRHAAAWFGCAVGLSALAAHAEDYRFKVVASGLAEPTGIAVRGEKTVYFTEVPTPGVGGGMGGMNAVKQLKVGSGKITTISMGEPEPVNLALDKQGTLYWTCKSAGVILRWHEKTIEPFLTGLAEPSGIAAGRDGLIYFTQVPQPGVGGGMNTTNVSNGNSITTLTMGEPEPSDIAVAKDGTTYWTCTTAGVILKRTPGGTVSLLLGGLNQPVGIALDKKGRKLYFTELPTPGTPGSMGGMNTVNVVNLITGEHRVIHSGDPEPRDVAVAENGNVYWTCTSAGVIVEARRSGKGHKEGDEDEAAEEADD